MAERSMNPRYLWLYLFAAALAFAAAAVSAFSWLGRGKGDWEDLVFPLILGSFMLFMWFSQRGKARLDG